MPRSPLGLELGLTVTPLVQPWPMDDNAVARIATIQHSLVSRSQALQLGFTDRAIKVRLNTGRWLELHDAVYSIAGAPDTWDQRHLAACMAVGPGAAVSHRSAAAIHGLWSRRGDLTEITVPRDTSPELDGVTVHRLADLTERWTTTVNGLIVTSPARTLVDVGAVMTIGNVGRMLDRAIGTRVLTLREAEFARMAVARRGRSGAGVVRRLLAERMDGPVAESTLQARMVTLLQRHAVPLPVLEHTILDGRGGFVGRVDFAYPEIKYAIEVDGFAAHTGLREFRHDRVRQNEIVDLGWLVHRFTWSEVDALSQRVAARVRAARSRLLGTLRAL